MKRRIDQLLVAKDLVESWAKAQALILAGEVLVNDQRVDKAGQLVEESAVIRFKSEPIRYASRGGLKLEHALKNFSIDASGKICLDVGASTGGFTDCLLQHGAKKVYAVDVGYGQFDWKLRNDPRVILLERKNIRTLSKATISEPIDLIAIDVSFISLRLVFPAIVPFLAPQAAIIALIKPQFEVGRGQVGKKGVVKDPKLHEAVMEQVKTYGQALGWKCKGITPSPIFGAEGNQEFLMYFSS